MMSNGIGRLRAFIGELTRLVDDKADEPAILDTGEGPYLEP